jgi:hypothetical protein
VASNAWKEPGEPYFRVELPYESIWSIADHHIGTIGGAFWYVAWWFAHLLTHECDCGILRGGRDVILHAAAVTRHFNSLGACA